jgi:hypothetical protein
MTSDEKRLTCKKSVSFLIPSGPLFQCYNICIDRISRQGIGNPLCYRRDIRFCQILTWRSSVHDNRTLHAGELRQIEANVVTGGLTTVGGDDHQFLLVGADCGDYIRVRGSNHGITGPDKPAVIAMHNGLVLFSPAINCCIFFLTSLTEMLSSVAVKPRAPENKSLSLTVLNGVLIYLSLIALLTVDSWILSPPAISAQSTSALN